MSFSKPLKYPCEATGRPEISDSVGCGFKTSCRNVLPFSSFCDAEGDGGEAALLEKVTLDELWLFHCVRWSYFYSFEISFLGFYSWNF